VVIFPGFEEVIDFSDCHRCKPVAIDHGRDYCGDSTPTTSVSRPWSRLVVCSSTLVDLKSRAGRFKISGHEFLASPNLNKFAILAHPFTYPDQYPLAADK
jgi:hypothetical protein